jgi:hypothetical protein
MTYVRGRRSRGRTVVGITTTYAISAYHHWCCEFESQSGWSVQDNVIKFVSDLWQVGGTHLSDNLITHLNENVITHLSENVITRLNENEITHLSENLITHLKMGYYIFAQMGYYILVQMGY